MPVASVAHTGSLYFVQCPVRNSPAAPGAQGLAGQGGRGAQSGHPVGFQHHLMGLSGLVCRTGGEFNVKMQMLVTLDPSKTTLQLTEALRLNSNCILDWEL